MELKRIDTLWHFFATQNNLFLKKSVEKEVSYRLIKGDIALTHSFRPNFLEQSILTIQSKDFEMAVHHYASAKRRFGFKVPFHNSHEKLFFPKELLKLNSHFNVYVEKDRSGRWNVALVPFHPKNIHQILKPVNLVTKTLWHTVYFSETIKN